jgi:hypothetical protein
MTISVRRTVVSLAAAAVLIAGTAAAALARSDSSAPSTVASPTDTHIAFTPDGIPS